MMMKTTTTMNNDDDSDNDNREGKEGPFACRFTSKVAATPRSPK